MRTRLMKEALDLLPVFGGALVLTLVPYVLWRQWAQDYGPVTFAVACALLGSVGFGGEFERGTLSLLLSQPASRPRLWLEKMAMPGLGIAACTAAVWSLSGASFSLVSFFAGSRGAALVLIPLCAFCGTPFFTLATRNTIAGVVFALVAPVLLAVGESSVYRLFPVWAAENPGSERLLGWLLAAYCAATLVLGFLKFRRLEVLDGRAHELVLPAKLDTALTRMLRRLAGGRLSGTFGTLVRKELRLQQTSFLVAALFCLVLVAGWIVHYSRPDWAQVITTSGFVTYVAAIPFIVGALAVAEERGLGLADWHFTLPPSAFQQWDAKVQVAISTIFLLGTLLPAAIYVGGPAWLRDITPPNPDPITTISMSDGLVVAFCQISVTSVAIYTGSFSRSALRAIVAGCILVAVVVGWIWLVPGLATATDHAGISRVLAWMIAALLLGWTQWFAWWNFSRREISRLTICGQLVRICLYGGGLSFLILCALLLLREVGGGGFW